MKSLLRIEKSGFHRGEYIGYCHGCQRITRGGQGWRTAGLRSAAGKPVYASAPTLAELDMLLGKLAEVQS